MGESQFKNKMDSLQDHIKTLRLVVVALVIVCLALFWGWKSAPSKLTVHVPPDLRTGSTRLWWDIPPENVYSFGLYLWGQINRWPSNGEEDYQRALYAYQNYLTPKCQAFLEQDYKKRHSSGELRNRVRGIYEILGRGYADNPALRVQQIDQNAWRVFLDMNVDEYYLSEPVRRALVRYPLRIVRYDVDSAKNPYGLALDCYDGSPQRLELPEGGST